MNKFELNRLTNNDTDNLLDEIRRVANLVDGPLVQQIFNKYAKVSSSTIRKRFGSWEKALSLAGLSERYFGPERYEKGHPRLLKFSNEQLIAELHIVAQKLGTNSFTMQQFDKCSSIRAATISKRFGSWQNAMMKANLIISKLGRRYSEDDYFENLLEVWTHHGRQPKLEEMDHQPSKISSGAYENKWGTWTKALLAFIERANSDNIEPITKPSASKQSVSQKSYDPINRKRIQKNPVGRSISIGLRYNVLKHDNFRCVRCGRSPATDLNCQLHVDHKIPVSKGGLTVSENLQTLCSKCNLGKRDSLE
jgi:hypothetical protein